MHKLIDIIEKEYINDKIYNFKVGDNVKVHISIIEGEKERVQMFNGIVIGRRGSGLSETFTVSRVSFGYAHEKTFTLYSPHVVKIEVVREGDVRRAKLNYIRGQVGKKSKVKCVKFSSKKLSNINVDNEDLNLKNDSEELS